MGIAPPGFFGDQLRDSPHPDLALNAEPFVEADGDLNNTTSTGERDRTHPARRESYIRRGQNAG